MLFRIHDESGFLLSSLTLFEWNEHTDNLTVSLLFLAHLIGDIHQVY